MQHGPQVAVVTINDYDVGQKCKCDHIKLFHYLRSYHVIFANPCWYRYGKQEWVWLCWN